MRPVDPAALLVLAYLGGALAMWGTYFDTAWHRTLTRDSFFSLPHLFIYGGAAVAWVAVILALALATRGALRDPGGPVARLGPLRLPAGWALAGVGILVVMAAAPADILWHHLFGRDATIWSPPHMQAVVGSMLATSGILFAAAAQRGRGALARRGAWTLAVLLPGVNLLHLAHYTLAHYTMIPAARTPDFYPFLVALLFPAVLVALARAVGPWAPPQAGLLLLAATVLVDLTLAAIAFERYTITPVVALPALVVTALYQLGRRAAARASLGVAAGALFALVFVAMEAMWMALGVGQPWPVAAVLRALPAVLLTGALSGAVGWVGGGFLRGVADGGGAAEVFGSVPRARWAAGAAMVLVAVGVVASYRPQVFGPPVRVEELALRPDTTFRVQEAVFWGVTLDDDFGRIPQLDLYNEGLLDGIPLPIGPAWCAVDDDRLARELPHLSFGLEVNGVPVDLAPYPLVPRRLHDGRPCAWVGVTSHARRASRNRFVYTITPGPGAPAGLVPIRVELTVVFKDA